ncbi:FtsX-like permease family protein [Prevotella sp.]|uniref:FtsX-like permease family protein n=1 Tax=Prevotella sp. TaxID=59823 RepID=UPI0025EBE13A|nr:FtsX-like permease family protein [Prevotella sp.]MCI6130785.1 FtsX-like permease family protein [Prevotella sp.]MCI7372122.1 FtsX-like permease family protein [Prevotella sp.]MDD6198635.1 FtsX-like permease family protein [Prevotella sp.]MDY3968481.1 FtsX-like permease family protein [Prevotella sp.]
MNFPFFIARRYVFSKKSTNAINVISAISVVGVAVGTMALVIVLSVFNGFHDLVASFFTNFDPQIELVPTQGKTAPADDPLLDKIRKMPQVSVHTDVLEDQGLAVYGDRQQMVTVMGVDDNFTQLTNISDILYGDGEFTLQAANLFYAIPGIRLAQDMGLGARFDGYLKLYAPVRRGQITDLEDPSDGFVVDSLISPGVVFAVNQAKYDRDHIICSIGFARRLFDQDGMLSSLQIRLKPGSDLAAVKKQMREIVGSKYRVLDRFEQQSDTFNIMQIEKVLAYVFLTFILMVACFNIISSLSMLIIDKKADAATLRNLGATDRQIRSIFLFEGRIISAIGAVVGILLGLLLCWLQQEFGLVHMGDSAGSFVVNAYPVSVHYDDVAIVFVTVLLIGWGAAWIPTRKLKV